MDPGPPLEALTTVFPNTSGFLPHTWPKLQVSHRQTESTVAIKECIFYFVFLLEKGKEEASFSDTIAQLNKPRSCIISLCHTQTAAAKCKRHLIKTLKLVLWVWSASTEIHSLTSKKIIISQYCGSHWQEDLWAFWCCLQILMTAIQQSQNTKQQTSWFGKTHNSIIYWEIFTIVKKIPWHIFN